MSERNRRLREAVARERGLLGSLIVSACPIRERRKTSCRMSYRRRAPHRRWQGTVLERATRAQPSRPIPGGEVQNSVGCPWICLQFCYIGPKFIHSTALGDLPGKSVLDNCIIGIAAQPALPRLGRGDHGMAAGVRMPGGAAFRGVIATQSRAALLASSPRCTCSRQRSDPCREAEGPAACHGCGGADWRAVQVMCRTMQFRRTTCLHCANHRDMLNPSDNSSRPALAFG